MADRDTRIFGGQVGLSGESEKILLTELGKVLTVAKPFILWPVMALMMVLVHLLWPAMPVIIITTALLGAAMSWFAYRYNRSTDLVSRLHGSVTIAICAGLLIASSLFGFNAYMEYIYLIGLPVLCLPWSIRALVKMHEREEVSDVTSIFEHAGVGPATLKLRRPEKTGKPVRKLMGRVALPFFKTGEQVTPEDLIRQKEELEAAWHMPPGSIGITPNEDRADWANIVISDPRGLNTNGIWLGPSIPKGGSVANPVSIGTWQDGETAELEIVNTHLSVMGMTGTGKSVGGGWSVMAELMTRDDVAIYAADITKGWQTLGPLRNGLHGAATTEQEAKDLLIDIAQAVKPRADYLASKGYHKWQPGCGLTYLVVWLEEAPDIVDALGPKGAKDWVSGLKAARSAGISFVISMQRADWTQLPTIARGQLAHWCFGVATKKDAAFGLSASQQAADVHPELWQARYPGKSYIDAPGIPPGKIALALRTWYWGDDDSVISAHADKYPASRVRVDAVTEMAMASSNAGGMPVIVDEPEDEIITPVIVQTPKDKLRDFIINDLPPFFQISHLTGFAKDNERTPQWLHKIMADFVDEGIVRLERDTDGRKIWHKVNQEESNLVKARRFQTNSKQRAIEYGSYVDPDLVAEHLIPLYEQRDCFYCGEPVREDRQIDHKIPLSRGGEHALDNLCCACSYCNERKGDRTEKEFRNIM